MVCEKGTNFDFQLLTDTLKKGIKFRLSLVSRNIKKGTKFQLSVVSRETQITHVISLTRKKKAPFSIERLFLTNIAKRQHYLVSYQ